MNNLRNKQMGSALIMAIFIIVVISLLAASLISLQRDSAEGASYDVYGARAYLAAYSASEIAVNELVSGTACASTDITTPTLPDKAGFYDCRATTACTEQTVSDDTLYKIVSTAVCGSNQIITRRQMTVGATMEAIASTGECFDVTEEWEIVVKNPLNNSTTSEASTLYYDDDLKINGNVSFDNIYVDGNVEVSGSAIITGNIYATGTVVVNKITYEDGYTYVNKDSSNGGIVHIISSLSITDGTLTYCITSDDSSSDSDSRINIIYRLQTFD